MSSSHRITVIPFPSVGVATRIHDGTNAPGFPKKVRAFLTQSAQTGATYFGESTVTGDTDGYTVAKGATSTWIGMDSRGSLESYDLSKIFYIGGPFKLILEVQSSD